MRTVSLLFTLLLLPAGVFGQETPKLDDMKQMLDLSQKRGQLEIEGGAPFHLVASFEMHDINGKSQGKGKLDELWESPKRYRRTLTVPQRIVEKAADGTNTFRQNLKAPARTLVEVDDGTRAWRTGQWVLSDSLGAGIDALLATMRLRSTIGDRLSYETLPDGNIGLDCVGTEPSIPGVPDETLLALTTYCMNEGNHLLRLMILPGFREIAFNDIRMFGNKYVPHSIEYGKAGRVLLRMHLDLIETPKDLSVLDAPPPEGAQILPGHRADQSMWSGELMKGQAIEQLNDLINGVVLVKVHVDTTGAVASAEVLSASNVALKTSALAVAKKWRFRVSYQGQKLVEVDDVITFQYGHEVIAY